MTQVRATSARLYTTLYPINITIAKMSTKSHRTAHEMRKEGLDLHLMHARLANVSESSGPAAKYQGLLCAANTQVIHPSNDVQIGNT